MPQGKIMEHADVDKLLENMTLQEIPVESPSPLIEWNCPICGVVIPEWESSYPTQNPERWLHDYRAVLISEFMGHTLSPVMTADEVGVDIRRARRKSGIYTVDIPKGYAFHARCWDLINLVLSRTGINKTVHLPETRLECFSRALEKTTEYNSLFRVPSRILPRNGMWLSYLQEHGNVFWWGTSKEGSKDEFLISDPVDIPEIQEAIIRCTWRKNSVPRERKTIPGFDLFLPLDLKCRIFDFLEAKDLHRALGSGEWGLPDFYWRSRLKEVFFEVDFLTSANIDWQGLWLALEPLVETSMGVLNRRRILQISREICHELIDTDREVAEEEDHKLNQGGIGAQGNPSSCKNWLGKKSDTYSNEDRGEEKPSPKRRKLRM